MELSCRVFLVSYPSNKQHRTVNPEPANSARFRSVKPSCEAKRDFKKNKFNTLQAEQNRKRGKSAEQSKPWDLAVPISLDGTGHILNPNIHKAIRKL